MALSRVFQRICQLAVTPLCLLACAGLQHTKPTGAYDHAVAVQESCCDHLGTDDARGACKQSIARTDAESAGDPLSRESFGCVAEHFTCDAATGQATHESAQAQLDCIDDLRTSRSVDP
jgi:hypothetical protein